MDQSFYEEKMSESEIARIVKRVQAQSNLVQPEDSFIPKFRAAKLDVEAMLGMGSFCRVFQVRCNEPEFREERYALKCLNRKLRNSSKKALLAASMDLVVETEILSRIEPHENIIALRGVASDPYYSDFGYFLLLELLDETLRDRLDRWREEIGPKVQGRFTRHHLMTSNSVCSRVSSIAIGVAKGLQHLHKNGVILRDLKPDNIGFDAFGTPKIFDLGLAREKHMIRPSEVAGSMRYIAPEAVLRLGVSYASDVYSFGVFLWELCTIHKPFAEVAVSKKIFIEQVMHNQWRPSLVPIPCSTLRRLISNCWDAEIGIRPDTTMIIKTLRLAVDDSKTVPPCSDNQLPSLQGTKFTTSCRVLLKEIGKGFKESFSRNTVETVSSYSSGETELSMESFPFAQQKETKIEISCKEKYHTSMPSMQLGAFSSHR